jgi:hypothetical protein
VESSFPGLRLVQFFLDFSLAFVVRGALNGESYCATSAFEMS